MLVEAAGRILPEVGDDMGRYTVEQLRSRSMEVLLHTRLESCVDGHVELSDGQRFEADTIVWTAGVKANPVVAATGLPLDERGRIRCRADLRVVGFDDAWAAGDNAAVPDLSSSVAGATCSPSAQHAVRQAKVLARNVLRVLDGQTPVEYRHRHVGSVASLGLHKGVAEVYGIKLRGFPAWFMHRTYHLSRCRRSTARLASSSTGRWRCSSGARWCRSGACTIRPTSSAGPRAPDPAPGRVRDLTERPGLPCSWWPMRM